MTSRVEIIKKLLARYFEAYPLTVLDVGASGGLQSRWKTFRKFIRVIGVEPDRKAYEQISATKRKNDIILDVALGENIGEAMLYIARKAECSSLFCPNTKILERYDDYERFEITATDKVRVSTLDAEFNRIEVKRADFMKLDVQGSELTILLGGRNIVPLIFGLEVEVEFLPLYEGQPLFADIDKALREFGFECFDIARHFWRRKEARSGAYKGQLVWGDALYFMNASKFIQLVSNTEDMAERSATVAKAVAICLIYGYPDYAKDLCNQSMEIIPKNDSEFINSAIDACVRKMFTMPDFRGMVRLSNILFRWYELLSFSKVNADDNKLGN